jgi:hypothetical protein
VCGCDITTLWLIVVYCHWAEWLAVCGAVRCGAATPPTEMNIVEAFANPQLMLLVVRICTPYRPTSMCLSFPVSVCALQLHAGIGTHDWRVARVAPTGLLASVSCHRLVRRREAMQDAVLLCLRWQHRQYRYIVIAVPACPPVMKSLLACCALLLPGRGCLHYFVCSSHLEGSKLF